MDATRLERNLNLALQVLEITDRAVVCLNLMDEARRHGLTVDDRRLARDLGVPVVATAARQGDGITDLLKAIDEVASGEAVCRPRRVAIRDPKVRKALEELTAQVSAVHPGLPNARWVALRLLGGDPGIVSALQSGELGTIEEPQEVTA